MNIVIKKISGREKHIVGDGGPGGGRTHERLIRSPIP